MGQVEENRMAPHTLGRWGFLGVCQMNAVRQYFELGSYAANGGKS